MITFIMGILGLFLIIGIISALADFKNSAISCILGILVLISMYGIISGVMNFMFWLGYQIGPPYAIAVTILLIASPFILWYLSGKLKSSGTIDSLGNKIKENKKIVTISIIIILVIVILAIVVPIITYDPLDTEPYTIERSAEFHIHKDKTGYPNFDNKFNGFITVRNNTDDIEIWHRDANGKSINYYLKQLKNNDLIKINKIKNISIDGEHAYQIKCDWKFGRFGDEQIIIFNHNDEYYLVYFNDISNETQKSFIEAFKFK